MTIQETRKTNFRSIIDASGLKVADFARKFDIEPSYISQLLNGHRGIGEKAARNIEKKVGLEQMALDAGRGDTPALLPNVTPAPIGHRLIPIINEVQAGTWREIREDFQTTEMLLTDLELSHYAFALTVRGDSMTPDFREGDRVIIDPEVNPVPGDFVAAVNGSDKATFKKYRERGVDATGATVFELVPLNQDYPTLRSDMEQISIIGTMMEHRKYRRKV